MYQMIPKPQKETRTLRFLYHTAPGRICLHAATAPIVSITAGKFMDSGMSRPMIRRFIRKNHICISMYEGRKYHSYNDFFTRKILPDLRPIDPTPTNLIAPCDGKLSVYSVEPDSTFCIKGTEYTLGDLLQDEKLATAFRGGYCLIFRLAVDDYHRYCYFDDGEKGENIFIQGKLHTVRDIAQEQYPIYKENCREYTVMETKHFGKAIQMEVGAMMVGRITNLHGKTAFTRGQEKGYFEFGGSTIVLLLQKNTVSVAPDILEATDADMESVVRMGEVIGRAIPVSEKNAM